MVQNYSAVISYTMEKAIEVSDAHIIERKADGAAARHIEDAKAKLNVVDLEALSREALNWKSKAARRMLLIIIVQGLSKSHPIASMPDMPNLIFQNQQASQPSQSMATLLVRLQPCPHSRTTSTCPPPAAAVGIINASMSIGNAVASPFQWLSDLIGRRGVSFLGNSILALGCILQAAAPNNACFIMGRVFGGTGASLSATVMPLYMSEVSPARYRGLAVGLTCSCYSIGSIIIAGVLLGGSYMPGNWSWRMPITFQIGPPVLCLILIYLCTPESPRYLVSRGQRQKAREMLAKYHTSSESVDDPIVELEMNQINQSLELIHSKPWDFSPLYRRSSGRYRLFIIVLYSFFQQCNGLGLLGYYLPGVLKLAGINNPQQQLGINVGMTVGAWISTIIGATLADRMRRRVLLMSGLAVFILFLGLVAAMGSLYANNISQNSTGVAMTVFVFAFQICNGVLGKLQAQFPIHTSAIVLTPDSIAPA